MTVKKNRFDSLDHSLSNTLLSSLVMHTSVDNFEDSPWFFLLSQTLLFARLVTGALTGVEATIHRNSTDGGTLGFTLTKV